MKQKSITQFFMAGLFLLLFLMTSSQYVIAATPDNDSDDDTVSDAVEDANERDIVLSIDKTSFSINSTARSEKNRDNIKFGFEYWTDGIKITTEYRSTYDNPTPDFESWVSIHSIFEYLDSDGDGVYNNPGAEYIQAANFTDIDFLDLDDDGDGYFTRVLRLTTADNNFTLEFYFNPRYARIGDSVITPFQTKLVLRINDFQYINPAGELVAEMQFSDGINPTFVETTEDEDLQYHTGEKALEFGTNAQASYVAWREESKLGSTAQTVQHTSLQTGSGLPNTAYFTLGHSDEISWDLFFGVKGLQKAAISPPGFSMDLISTLIGVGAGALGVGAINVIQKYRTGGKHGRNPRGDSKILRSDEEIQAQKHKGWDGTVKGSTSIEQPEPTASLDNSINEHLELATEKIEREQTNTSKREINKGWNGTIKGTEKVDESESIQGYSTRKRVEVLKSNKQGDPNLNRKILDYGEAGDNIESPQSTEIYAGNPIGGLNIKGGQNPKPTKRDIFPPNSPNPEHPEIEARTGHVTIMKGDPPKQPSKREMSSPPSSAADIQNLEEKERGKTINTSHVEYETQSTKPVPGVGVVVKHNFDSTEARTGHVIINKGEPPRQPSKLEVKPRRVEMAKSEITQGDLQEGRKILDYGEAGGNIAETEMTQSGPNLINPIAMDKGLGKITANDIKPKEKEYKGHVTLLKREAPPSPPSQPSSPEHPGSEPSDTVAYGGNPIPGIGVVVKKNMADEVARKIHDYGEAGGNMIETEMAQSGSNLINPIAMDKGLRREQPLESRSSVDNPNPLADPQGHSTKDKDKDKDKEKESKKEFVGHVSLMK